MKVTPGSRSTEIAQAGLAGQVARRPTPAHRPPRTPTPAGVTPVTLPGGLTPAPAASPNLCQHVRAAFHLAHWQQASTPWGRGDSLQGASAGPGTALELTRCHYRPSRSLLASEVTARFPPASQGASGHGRTSIPCYHEGQGARRWPRDLPKAKARLLPSPCLLQGMRKPRSQPPLDSPSQVPPRAAVHWIYGMCKLNARKAFIKPGCCGNKDALVEMPPGSEHRVLPWRSRL